MSQDTSTRLASLAAKVSQAIYTGLDLKPSDLESYSISHEIGARLYAIKGYLTSLPPYWVDSDVEDLCVTVLRDLDSISKAIDAASNRQVRGFTIGRFFSQSSSTDQKYCLVTFFKKHKEHARRLRDACDSLIRRLDPEKYGAGEVPESSLRSVDVPDTFPGMCDGIFNALQIITECNLEMCGTQSLRHTARLCLHEQVTSTENSTSNNVSLVVSNSGMSYWQEFCLLTQAEWEEDEEGELLSQGSFCPILTRQVTARIFLSFKANHGLSLMRESGVLKQILQAGPGESLKSVLRCYDLTPKDKVMLAYAIALAYWQHYDSNLMRSKWTSDTIWFMPEEGRKGRSTAMPLLAYVTLPFVALGGSSPDIEDDSMLTHRCPRIFDVGILLLEIGLARPFQTRERLDNVSQANFNHKMAMDELFELQNTKWEGFQDGKKYFDAAVGFCFNSENFVPVKRPGQGRKTSTKKSVSTLNPAAASILSRRRIFYQNVVRPLAWLAKKGFRARAGEITYAVKKPEPTPQNRGATNGSLISDREALFHSNIIPEMWLRDLKKISVHVEFKRRQHGIDTPVRIAILDTGLDRSFPGFNTTNELLTLVRDEKDFVNPDASCMTDEFGHGTLMTRLIMESAPGAEILVARVAQNTNELRSSQKYIREGILWAGEQKADIISMSFGFPRDDQGIIDAIEEVKKKRQGNIIFFASAGNSSTDDESFPARHPSVISVSATNCRGIFQSTPLRPNKAGTVLGTFGDDVPDTIQDEFRTTFPKICRPGSSIATAIMAGISATMLAYTSVLPSLVKLQGAASIMSTTALQQIWTTKGMEAVLHLMAPSDDDHPRLKAVKPMWFWKEKQQDFLIYFALCDTLSKVERTSSRFEY